MIEFLADNLGSARCVACGGRRGVICRACRATMTSASRPPSVTHIDRVVAGWDYDDVARSLVLALKVRGCRDAASELGRVVVEEVWRQGLAVEVLTWIPARRRDIRARGFDHAEAIAKVVSRGLGLPVVPALERTRHRLDQTTLGLQERKVNLTGAFAARPVGARVGVVDDLMTTGATLADAGRALREAGAMRVEGLVACFVS